MRVHLAAKISSTTRVLTRIMLLCNVGGQVLTNIRSRYAMYSIIIELGIVWHADRENGCGCLSGIVLGGE